MSLKSSVENATRAQTQMAALSSVQKNQALGQFGDLIWENREMLLKENAKDLKRETEKLSGAMMARLKLDEDKIRILVEGIRALIGLPDPVNQVLSKTLLDDGLVLEKKSVPIGVIAVIFESRPDVIPQILSLFLKSGNVALLKGGKEAERTNKAFLKLVHQMNSALNFLPQGWAQLFLDRKDVDGLLKFDKAIHLVIPRGGNKLVQTVMSKTKIPVLGHADGVCHIYWDQDLNLDVAKKVTTDAKTQYPATCNAVETLLVHQDHSEQLGQYLEELSKLDVEIFGDSGVRKIFKKSKPVKNWHTEFGDFRIAVRIVKDLDTAIDHINTHGSHHTDAIISNKSESIEKFLNHVDSASVLVNASTRFADGYRFGMGAEVGVSTNKTHARGPVGIEGLVIYKYVVRGNGQIVSSYVGPQAKKFKHQKI